MLEVKSIVKTFADAEGSVQVLKHAALQLQAGEAAALLGESGSGKSTLLNLIAGLDQPDSGYFVIDDESTENFTAADWNDLRRNKLGLVFQQYHLVPTLTVQDNLKLQARLSGRWDRYYFDNLVTKLGLTPLLKRLPHQLSGGQQQRVAIGRALMHKPRLLLADEPTGNLDEATSAAVMALLTELVRESQCALLMVTHSQAMAAYLQHCFELTGGVITRVSR